MLKWTKKSDKLWICMKCLIEIKKQLNLVKIPMLLTISFWPTCLKVYLYICQISSFRPDIGALLQFLWSLLLGIMNPKIKKKSIVVKKSKKSMTTIFSAVVDLHVLLRHIFLSSHFFHKKNKILINISNVVPYKRVF